MGEMGERGLFFAERCNVSSRGYKKPLGLSNPGDSVSTPSIVERERAYSSSVMNRS
jgi:hypothetical protein